jgi:hypothetical protein
MLFAKGIYFAVPLILASAGLCDRGHKDNEWGSNQGGSVGHKGGYNKEHGGGHFMERDANFGRVPVGLGNAYKGNEEKYGKANKGGTSGMSGNKFWPRMAEKAKPALFKEGGEHHGQQFGGEHGKAGHKAWPRAADGTKWGSPKDAGHGGKDHKGGNYFEAENYQVGRQGKDNEHFGGRNSKGAMWRREPEADREKGFYGEGSHRGGSHKHGGHGEWKREAEAEAEAEPGVPHGAAKQAGYGSKGFLGFGKGKHSGKDRRSEDEEPADDNEKRSEDEESTADRA